MSETSGTKPATNGASPQPTEKNEVSTVHISEAERQSGRPSASTVGAAVSILHRDGIVVLDNAVSTTHIDALHQHLNAALPALLADPSLHYNGPPSSGNISQSPPLDPALMPADIWTNPFAAAVVAAVLGPRPRIHYVNGNTALPGTAAARQPVHADLLFRYPSAPFALVANYYLCDTTAANGATEVWLRSHRATHPGMHEDLAAGVPWIREECLEARRAAGWPPIRPEVRRGAVVVRRGGGVCGRVGGRGGGGREFQADFESGNEAYKETIPPVREWVSAEMQGITQ